MSDLAGSRIITRRNQRFSTFALCLRMPAFAALCCTEMARKGQRPRLDFRLIVSLLRRSERAGFKSEARNQHYLQLWRPAA
jgi:hypothetical protein